MLATVSSGVGAYRIRRSHLRIDGDSIRVGIDTGGKSRVGMNWRRLDAPVAQRLRWMLQTTYAMFEQGYRTAGVDYAFLSGHQWDGTTLVPAAEGELALVDPRYRLLLTLGAERRSEQMLACERGHLVEVAGDGRIALDDRTRGVKRAALQLLSPFQERAVGFALEFGYLADIERAYGVALAAWMADPERMPEPNYALFPKGQLAQGRAVAALDRPAPANDRTLSDWNNQVESALGIAHAPGRALRGWRRALSDVYRPWTRDETVLDRLMDHAKVKSPERGSTRHFVYLDPKDLVVLSQMADLVEYARTTFAQTGVARSPDV